MKKIIPGDLSKRQDDFDFFDEEKIQILKTLLNIPCEKRTKLDCLSIADIVGHFKFFSPHKESKLFPELCQYLKIEQYAADQIVFRQGNHGDRLYLILTGSVSVNLNLPFEKKSTGMKEITTLSKGQFFGELAVMQGTLRTASVVVLENTDLMVLEKAPFQKFFKDPKALNLHKIKRILSRSSVNKNLSEDQLDELSLKSTLKKFDTNTLLIKQGSPVNHFCFIKSGLLKICRSVNFRIDLTSKEINGDTSDPTSEEIEAGLFKTLTLEITEIGAGEMFAEYAAIQQLPIDYSVVAVVPSDIILIESKDLKETLDPDNFELFKKECRNYPLDEELRRKYYSQKEWSQMRLGIIRKTIQLNISKNTSRQRLLEVYSDEKEDQGTKPGNPYRKFQLNFTKSQTQDVFQSSSYTKLDLPPITLRRKQKLDNTTLISKEIIKPRSQSLIRQSVGGIRSLKGY